MLNVRTSWFMTKSKFIEVFSSPLHSQFAGVFGATLFEKYPKTLILAIDAIEIAIFSDFSAA